MTARKIIHAALYVLTASVVVWLCFWFISPLVKGAP